MVFVSTLFRRIVCLALIFSMFTLGGYIVRAVGQPILTERASVSTGGTQANLDSANPSISGDGKLLAFDSAADNLVASDANSRRDIFVRDRETEATERVSVSGSGGEANGDSINPAISSDSRFVAFESAATNLVAGDTNGRRDIFVHDRQTGATERVSIATGGAEANGDSFKPSINSDGRFVAFESIATNLVDGDSNGRRDIFVRDRQTGTTERISVSESAAQANRDSFNPSISGDGRFVAFESLATNLIDADGNGRRDIFVRDRQAATIERVSVATGGAQANADSFNPSINADGSFVAFESLATNLVAGDGNRRRDIFLRDRQNALTERVSVSSGGAQGNGDSSKPSINGDGRFVAFESLAKNLVAGDTNKKADIFVRDRLKSRTTRESVAAPGIEANSASDSASIDAAGDIVAFVSLATNLVLNDTNGRRDVFVHEPTQTADLVAQGEDIFFNETFGGNGRTCGTCHPAENKFTIDPAFIAQLPATDPLFVAEFNPDLAELEKPELMRQFGLIQENADGFDKPGVMRGVPHTKALATSVASLSGPRTGWSGDGAPGDGTLRSFAVGAVRQHFTKTLNRVEGVDFRLPTEEELDALEAFQLSLGRQADLSLPLALKGTVPAQGQQIFLDDSVGKCNLCHRNAGASSDVGGGNLGNTNFNIDVESLPFQPARLFDPTIPIDGGLGNNPRPGGGFGDGSFNVPPLVEAADSPPFFHNNAALTIEDAVAFYNTSTFNGSPSTNQVGGINLNGVQINAVAAFLRVINVLENIRSAIAFQEKALLTKNKTQTARFLSLAGKDIESAITVLQDGSLHADAVTLLQQAQASMTRRRNPDAIDAMNKAKAARDLIVEPE
jgi:Tol biopolymer transport system component